MFASSPRAPRRAFTLIEILVVIGIIALLGAILFPVLGRARENGRKTVCASNMRQLGLAFQQYSQDFNGRYPLAGQYQIWANGAHWVTGGQGGVPRNYSIAEKGLAQDGKDSGFGHIDMPAPREAYVDKGAIYSYAKSAGVYTCPSAKDVDKKKLSYSMNCAVAGISQIRIKTPSEIVLLMDEGDTLNDGYLWAVDDANSTDSLFKGHNGGGNILFADGRVKFYPFNTLPVDWNTQGRSLKSAQTGQVRFHDRAFGATGSNYVASIQERNSSGTITAPVDTCTVPLPSATTPGTNPAGT
jgi:prepilin-type N-terminal cleavage/methylation domain-containing protein/prepilin-type processing-associated H-X9-DG protein